MPRPAGKLNLEVVPTLASAAVHEGWGGKDLVVRVEAEVDAVTFALAGLGFALALAGLGFATLGPAAAVCPRLRFALHLDIVGYLLLTPAQVASFLWESWKVRQGANRGRATLASGGHPATHHSRIRPSHLVDVDLCLHLDLRLLFRDANGTMVDRRRRGRGGSCRHGCD